MPAGVSSKHIKYKSDVEGRSRKKKIKSSGKRGRRRDSSPSSFSTDSEDDSRARRKSSRPEPKRPRRSSSRGDYRRRRKESKKPDTKKARKPRYRRETSASSTSSSGSSRSCSTCGARSSSIDNSVSVRTRSRSPALSHRKAKLKVKGRSRGRDRGRRTRYRSPSYSTCSGYSSRSPSRSPHKEKSREKGVSRRPRTKTLDDDRDKIIRAYDDFQPSQSNDGDGYSEGRKREKKGQGGEAAAVGKAAANARGEDGPYKKRELVSSKANTQPPKNVDGGGNDSGRCQFGSAKDLSTRKNPKVIANTLPYTMSDDFRDDSLNTVRKNAAVVASTGSPEAEDLELILRQKALQNFRKFRGGLSASSRSLGDHRDENVGTETVEGSVKSIECKPASSLENHSHTQLGGHLIEAGAKSVANTVASVPINNVGSNLVGDHKITTSNDGRNTQNQVNKVHESSNKMSSEQLSFSKDIQGKRGVAEPGSSNARGAEVNITDGLASEASCLITESGNCKSGEPVAEAMSRTQFEQRTFSRMHDGEMVQVSYKVYIPKKTPALARRQLQR